MRLRTLQIGVRAVNQVASMHDSEMPGVIDREQYVRDAYGSEVAVCRSILEGVGQKLVALGGQGREQALAVAEVVTRCGMTDPNSTANERRLNLSTPSRAMTSAEAASTAARRSPWWYLSSMRYNLPV